MPMPGLEPTTWPGRFHPVKTSPYLKGLLRTAFLYGGIFHGAQALNATIHVPVEPSARSTSAVTAQPPLITNAIPTGSQPSGTTQVTLTLTTSETATCRFSTTSGTSFAAMREQFTTTGGTTHSTMITGLANGGTYNFYLLAQSAANNSISAEYAVGLSVALPSGAITRRVGPGKTYSRPSLAAAAAQTGDIIEIDAGTYPDDATTWNAGNLTIRGVGGRAQLRWTTGQISNGKAIWVIRGASTTVENTEFSGAKVADQNGAGIRQEGAGLVLRNCYIHDNENGILTDSGNWDILIENSEFANNSFGDGYTHNLYIGNIRKFTFQHSYSHHAQVGHNLKSRAKENYILYNRIMDEATGTASYAIDIPNGGTTYVIGNLIQQGPANDNSGIMSYAAEGGSNPDQHLYVTSNTFVNDYGSGTHISVSGTTPIFARNNLFIGPGTLYSGPGSVNLITDNLATTAGLVDRTNYDYDLAANSTAINRGSDPGSANGVSLLPVYQYVHPLSRETRPINGSLDFGAYEYATIAPSNAVITITVQ